MIAVNNRVVLTSVSRLNNDQPLNQHARRLLDLAGEEPNQSGLYLLQLAAWGLVSNQVDEPDQETRELLLEKVRSLQDWPHPEKAYRYLLDNPDDPENPLLEDNDLDEVQAPADGAAVVLEAFEAALTMDPREDWPRVNRLP